MKYFKYVFLVLVASVVFTACQSDDDFNYQTPTPTGDYVNGFFVVNEGPFGGSGSLSFIKNDFSQTTNNVFATVNPNQDIGSFVQSVFFDDERMFIISNGSNLINVVNRYTLEFIAVIDSGLEVPRFGTVINDKAYVTNLASFESTTDDYIAIINLINYEVEGNIAVNNVANEIFAYDGKLVVQNAAFSNGNSITLIDPLTQQILSVLDVGEGLNSMAQNENNLYALSATQFTQINLNDFSIMESSILPDDAMGVRNLKLNQNQAFYTLGNEVFSSPIPNLSFTEEALFSYNTTSDFGVFYGFNVHNQQIYIADAGDFASDGKIFVFDFSGNQLMEAEVGLGPNGFYFN